MKISMTLLSKYLENYNLVCDINQDKLSIKGVRILPDEYIKFSNEFVYFGNTNSFITDDKYANTFLLVNGKSRIMCYDCNYEKLWICK